MSLLLYLFQVLLLMIIGLLLYHRGLKPLRCFSISRWWLFFLIPFSLLLPYVATMLTVPYSPGEDIVVTLNTVLVGPMDITAPETAVSGGISGFMALAIIIYLLGFSYFSWKWTGNILRLKSFLSGAKQIDQVHGVKVYSCETQLPFTFLNRIYLPIKTDPNSDDYGLILMHELTHVKKLHWVDNFWLMGWSLVLWFIPLIGGIRSALQEVHEFQADEAVVRRYGPRDYLSLIVSMLNSRESHLERLNSVSPFISKTIKTRIMMITTKKIQWKLPALTIALSFILIGGLGFMSCQSEQSEVENDQAVMEVLQDTESSMDGVLEVAEQMPRFPGCEDISGSQAEKKACADQKMLEFIYQNIKYPAIARENGIQGTTVVSFVVDVNGLIQEPKIMRDIGGGCGQEALRVVQLMNKMPQQWTPGMHEGEAVRVRFNLPIRFTLQ